MRVELTVFGKPEPGGSKVRSRYGTIRDANPNVAAWKDRIAQRAGLEMKGREPLHGPLRARFTFYLTRPRSHYGGGRNAGTLRPSAPERPTVAPDTTKLVRSAEDSLRGIVYRDDAQIVTQIAEKFYGEPVRVEISVTELELEPPR